MEKVSDLEKNQKERNVSRIVKGSVFAILLTFIFLLLFLPFWELICFRLFLIAKWKAKKIFKDYLKKLI